MSSMMIDLTGKNILITGTTSGLGRHFALTLAATKKPTDPIRSSSNYMN